MFSCNVFLHWNKLEHWNILNNKNKYIKTLELEEKKEGTDVSADTAMSTMFWVTPVPYK